MTDTKDTQVISKADIDKGFFDVTRAVKFNITDTAIDELRIEHKVKPVTNTKELKENAASIAVIRTLRVNVDKKRKELKKDALEYGRKIETEAQRITTLLTSIEKPLSDAKEVYEAERAAIAAEKQRIEDERIKNIKDKIDEIKNYPSKFMFSSSLRILEAIEQLLFSKDHFDYQEFANEALQVKTVAIEDLKQLKDSRDAHDKQEREAEERRIALEKQEAELKEEREKLEQERLEAKKKVDRELLAIEAERAETARLVKIEQDKLAKERQGIACHVDVVIKGDIITCPHCDGKFQLNESEQND